MVAAIFIAIYPIGIIVIFVALLFANRKVLGDNAGGAAHAGKWWAGDLETFHFLVAGYRREAFWYEIVDFVRCGAVFYIADSWIVMLASQSIM